MLVVIMFVSAIFVLRRLDLGRGKIDAEEIGPISPATLEDIPEESEGTVPDFTAKEDGD
jgi:hypothetical protein